MKRRIYEIVEVADFNDKASSLYDAVMILVIAVSLIPLGLKTSHPFFDGFDKVVAAVFAVDYILRLYTSDFKYEDPPLKSLIRYIFSFWAIVDFLSMLPSVLIISHGLKYATLIKVLKSMRLIRAFKMLRYSKSFRILGNVFVKARNSLTAVVVLAATYILLTAILIFNVEPENFGNFFDAIYWATVSLTTVGYGDLYPVTALGRLITMVSSIFGIAIVALPSGIITAEYMNELNQERARAEAEKAEKEKETHFSIH